MAIPIKDTPVLKGKNAKKFRASMEDNRDKRVSPAEMKKIDTSFEKINGMRNF